MKRNTLYILISATLSCTSLCAAGSMTVDPLHKQARVCKDTTCSTYKVINFFPTGGASPVTLNNNTISGYAWGEELGWVNFSPSGSGVVYNQASGTLSGYAWASASGWINFRPSNSGTVSLGVPVGVILLSNGNLYGWAFASGIGGGWILFDCAQAATCVTFVDQTPPPVTPPTNSGGFFSPPTPTTPQPPVVPEPPVPQTPPAETPLSPTPPKPTTPKPEETKSEKIEEVEKTQQENKPDTQTEAVVEQKPDTQAPQSVDIEKAAPTESGTAVPLFSASGFFSALNPFSWFAGTPVKNTEGQSQTSTSNQVQNGPESKEPGGFFGNQQQDSSTANKSWAGKVLAKVTGAPAKATYGIARVTYSLFDVFVALVKSLVE